MALHDTTHSFHVFWRRFPYTSWKATKVSPMFHLMSFWLLLNHWLSMHYIVWFGSRFPLQTPRRYAGRFCLCAGWFTDSPLYKSRLYRKTSSERRFHVQVSQNLPIIDPIPRDLSRKTRREAHFDVQARLVHRFVGSARQIRLEETGPVTFFFSAKWLIFISMNRILHVLYSKT